MAKMSLLIAVFLFHQVCFAVSESQQIHVDDLLAAQDFPDDLFGEIFSFSGSNDLRNLAASCTSFNKIVVNDPILLRRSHEPVVHYSIRKAVHQGDVELFSQLMSDPSTILECLDAKGRTPLHLAIEIGNVGLVQALLDRGANVAAKWNDQSTLTMAVLHNKPDILNTLLRIEVERGIDIHVPNNVGKFPIHLAAQNGNVEAMRLILQFRDVIHLQTEQLQYTPLHLAAMYGHLDAVKYLLREGADPTARAYYEITPYDLASESVSQLNGINDLSRHQYIEIMNLLNPTTRFKCHVM